MDIFVLHNNLKIKSYFKIILIKHLYVINHYKINYLILLSVKKKQNIIIIYL